MAEKFKAGIMPHEAKKRLSKGEYESMVRNIVYACTDVLIRDEATGRVFLIDRTEEPQVGPWFPGGRDVYGSTPRRDAAAHLKTNTGLELNETRFRNLTGYSMEQPVANTGVEEYGRHAFGDVMSVDLERDEVEALDAHMADNASHGTGYTGRWYDLKEIMFYDSDFPDGVKYVLQQLYERQVLDKALHKEALRENRKQKVKRGLAKIGLNKEHRAKKRDKKARLSQLEARDFTPEQAVALEQAGGIHAVDAVDWVRRTREDENSQNVHQLLEEIASNRKLGDSQVKRKLERAGITPPEVKSENGPRLRRILDAAVEVLNYDFERKVKNVKKALGERYGQYEVDGHPITDADFELVEAKNRSGGVVHTVMLTSLKGIDLGDPDKFHDPARSYDSIMANDSHKIEINGQEFDSRGLTKATYYRFVKIEIAKGTDPLPDSPDSDLVSTRTWITAEEKKIYHPEVAKDLGLAPITSALVGEVMEGPVFGWNGSDSDVRLCLFRPAIVVAK